MSIPNAIPCDHCGASRHEACASTCSEARSPTPIPAEDPSGEVLDTLRALGERFAAAGLCSVAEVTIGLDFAAIGRSAPWSYMTALYDALTSNTTLELPERGDLARRWLDAGKALCADMGPSWRDPPSHGVRR